MDQLPVTYLYIKTHNKTGLKYFGKTTRDPYTYVGSGTRWNNHLKKHGYDITTEVIGAFTSKQEINEVAIRFSIDNNIVESLEWANLRIEDGLEGGRRGTNGKHSEETINLIKLKTTGIKKPEETKQRMREAWIKRKEKTPPKQPKQKLTPEELAQVRKNVGLKLRGRVAPNRGKKASQETKDKISKANTGRKHSEEAKRKMSQSRKGISKPIGFGEKVSKRVKGVPLSESHIASLKESFKTRKINRDYSKSSTVKGRLWWNNGTKSIRKKEWPGEGWVRGQLRPTKTE